MVVSGFLCSPPSPGEPSLDTAVLQSQRLLSKPTSALDKLFYVRGTKRGKEGEKEGGVERRREGWRGGRREGEEEGGMEDG